MRLHELTERGQGADGASELIKRKTDPTSPQNKNRKNQIDQPQPGAGTGPSMSFKMNVPQQSVTMKDYRGGM